MKDFLKSSSPWISFLLILVTLITYIGIPYFFYFYLFLVGVVSASYVLKETKFNTIILIFLSSFFWSSCFLISLSGLFALLSIPLGLWLIWLPVLFLLVLLITKPLDLTVIELKIEITEIILLVLAVFSVGAHILSIMDYFVPILHDPIAHAVWAKGIYETGLINYFYSPGLHILSALGMMADGINVSKYVLLITNLFNALTFIPVYLFVRSYFRDKKFALLSAALFVIAVFPSKFFWAAGKNALVMGISLIFLAFFLASTDLGRIKKFVVLNLLIFTLILTHYPAAFIGLIGVFFILIYRKGVKSLLHIALGSILGIFWGLAKMKYQITHMEESVSSISEGLAITMDNTVSFFRSFYLQIQPFFDFPFGSFLLVFGFLGLSIMIAVSIKKKRNLFFTLFLLTNAVAAYMIEFIPGLGFLRIVYLTQILTAFMFIYLGVASLFAEVILPYLLRIEKRFIYLFYFSIILLSFYSCYGVYSKYSTYQKDLNMVREEDLQVFEWMEENVKEDIILNNAAVGNRKSIVFASDGGAWIPVFTDLQIAMPFTEFSSERTHANYERYLSISNGNYSCDDIDYFLENDINYYYHGSRGIFGKSLVPEEGSSNFELMYSVGEAKLYEILPCQ